MNVESEEDNEEYSEIYDWDTLLKKKDSYEKITSIMATPYNNHALLAEFPSDVNELDILRKIYLENKEIFFFPPHMVKFINLVFFSFNNFVLAEYPKFIDNFINLKSLSLRKTKLKVLPESIGKLVKLKELYLCENELENLPDSITNLKDLILLRLDRNNLSKLPDEIGKFDKLLELDLRNNVLTELPESIGNLTNLEELKLRLNKIKYIPSTIGNLTKVYINFSHNKLTGLPLSIKNVSRIDIFPSSYDDFDKISPDCEYLQIERLNVPLRNLPIYIKEIRLTKPKIQIGDIKVPFGCELYVNNVLQ